MALRVELLGGSDGSSVALDAEATNFFFDGWDFLIHAE
jgi:hypothetical protein